MDKMLITIYSAQDVERGANQYLSKHYKHKLQFKMITKQYHTLYCDFIY